MYRTVVGIYAYTIHTHVQVYIYMICIYTSILYICNTFRLSVRGELTRFGHVEISYMFEVVFQFPTGPTPAIYGKRLEPVR